MRGFLESWWATGPFVGAVLLNLILFDRHNTGEWYGPTLAAIVIFLVVALAVDSPLMGIIGLFAMVALVVTGVILLLRKQKQRPNDS